MKRWIRSTTEIGEHNGVRYGIEEGHDQRFYFRTREGRFVYADSEEEIQDKIDAYLNNGSITAVSRFDSADSDSVPEELASRPYGFILNSVNSTWNDDILEIAESHGAIKVKYDTVNPKTGKFFRTSIWHFAVHSEEDAYAIFTDCRGSRIPLHQTEVQIVNNNWTKAYNIKIDDYQRGIISLEWHRAPHGELPPKSVSASWYVGEPSDYGRGGHSVYSNPKGWEAKRDKIREYIEAGLYDVRPGTCTPSTYMIQSKVDGSYFKFDLWEDDATIDEQIDAFDDWVLSKEETR